MTLRAAEINEDALAARNRINDVGGAFDGAVARHTMGLSVQGATMQWAALILAPRRVTAHQQGAYKHARFAQTVRTSLFACVRRTRPSIAVLLSLLRWESGV